MIFQQLANSFKGGHVDGNSVVKCACHGVVTGWVTSWEVSPVRREVLHQPYLVKALPPGPQRYQAGVPARDWGGGRCQSGVQGVAAMRGRAVTYGIGPISSRNCGEHCLVDELGYEHDEGVMSLRWGGCNTPEFSSI